jgi:streptomycin 6-kinase
VIDRAEKIFEELLLSSDPTILLHGDLHHWNILSAGDNRWLAIDPKGVLGDQAYETGAWLRNPYPLVMDATDVKGLIKRRLDQFVDELGLDRDRILNWAFAQAVLAAWWSYEDGDSNWRTFQAWAQIFLEDDIWRSKK